MADARTDAVGLIDAFTRDLAAFVSGLVGVAGSVQPAILNSRPSLRARCWFHADGAVITVPIPNDIWYLGSAIIYASGQVTVSISGEGQAQLVGGGVSRELAGMIGGAGPISDTFGKIRMLLHANSTFSINTNTGPVISAHLFELA